MEQIELFYKVGKKCDNDGDNKCREDILLNILNISQDYLDDPEYGAKWREVKNGWCDVLKDLYKEKEPYDKIDVVKMAGRGHNYDYSVIYNKDKDTILQKTCLEFKYNSLALYKLPQFLQIHENCGFLKVSYAEFYYDNYLSKHISHIPLLELIDKEVYLKNIKGVNYNCNPFFAKLKAAEEDIATKAAIDKLVKESISEYLSKYASDIDLEPLQKRLNESQRDKVFIMWKNGKFTKDQISIGTQLEYKGIKNKNTIVIEDVEQVQEYHLLLRWKNHKGVLNPAWQISLHKGLTLVKKLVK
jgi:hypothetical protein